MTRKKPSRVGRPFQFLRNLTAGRGGPVERALKVAGNLARRRPGTSGCCGNYGEPGC